MGSIIKTKPGSICRNTSPLPGMYKNLKLYFYYNYYVGKG